MAAANAAREASRDLLAGVPPRRASAAPGRRGQPPELAAAHALCRQLRRKQGRLEKQRIAHLICMNLVSLLQRGSERQRRGHEALNQRSSG